MFFQRLIGGRLGPVVMSLASQVEGLNLLARSDLFPLGPRWQM